MDAIDRLGELAQAVGDDKIISRCEVDQPYAQAQHEELGWAHPRGGRSRYLGGPLVEEVDQLMSVVADSLITPDGTDIVRGMIRVSELMSKMVRENAPRLDEVLRYSGHTQVVNDGQMVYDHPPLAPRKNND